MMTYPNGCITLGHLKEMIGNPDFIVYAEKVEPTPENWDWKTQGFYRGPRNRIENLEQLSGIFPKVISGEYTICYDTTADYFRKHPHLGEEVKYVKEEFRWEYAGTRNYALREYDTKDGKTGEEVRSIELIEFQDNFESNCWVLGWFTFWNGEYNFEGLSGRFFNIPEEDLEVIWPALKAADEYLGERK